MAQSKLQESSFHLTLLTMLNCFSLWHETILKPYHLQFISYIHLTKFYITADVRNTNSSREVNLNLADINEVVLYETS